MTSTFLNSLAVLLLTYTFLQTLLRLTQSVQEPPPMDTSLPFISPIIRMAWTGVKYWKMHSRLPIYTIRLPATRLYVVNSRSLISVVERQSQTLSFSPILSRVASNLIAASKPGVEILSQDEEHGFIARFHDFNHAHLSPGPSLDALKRKMWDITTSLRSHEGFHSSRKVHMYQWISEEVTTIVTRSIFGQQNPFRGPKTQALWSDYESGTTRLMAGFMSSLTARRSIRAREDLGKAFEQYYDGVALNDPETSTYVKQRHDFFSQSGLSSSDIAKLEAAFTIALLSNTIPATFWLLYHILSDSVILQDCRKELVTALQRYDDPHSLDPTTMEHSCPTLVSTFYETLRTHGMGVSVRQVVEDQHIDDQYLLKKGGLVLIPSGVQHTDQSAWGEHVNDFDHLRFLGENGRRKGWNSTAFRGFGGGLILCPGRHVATSAVLGFAASTILNLDVQPTDGQWEVLSIKNSSFSTSINKPDTDVVIEICCLKAQE